MRQNTYTLEDWTGIINEYDRYLAPYLSILEPRDPLNAKEPDTTDKSVLLRTIQQFKQAIAIQNALIERLLRQSSHPTTGLDPVELVMNVMT
jgi:hypothetical protein